MVADEDWDKGLSQAPKGSRSASGWRHPGLIDFLNIIRGHIEHDDAAGRRHPGHRHAGLARISTSPARCGPRRKFPVFHAARINDVATARHAIAEGKLDMVGMTRAHIADPHIVRKIAEGREHEIRPCVGATYCLDRIYEGDERALHPQSGDRRARRRCRM